MIYENKPPDWEAIGDEPPKELKTNGYKPGYKPPASYFNWFWTKVSKCLQELHNRIAGEIKKDDAGETLGEVFNDYENNIATGKYSHAEGNFTTSSGECSHTQGLGTKAEYANQTVIGKYNLNNSNNILEIGNGTDDLNRKNIFSVEHSGNVNIAGDITGINNKHLSTNDYTTAEKNKLSGIEAGANKYVLPQATSSALGGVRLYGSTGSNTNGTMTQQAITNAVNQYPNLRDSYNFASTTIPANIDDTSSTTLMRRITLEKGVYHARFFCNYPSFTFSGNAGMVQAKITNSNNQALTLTRLASNAGYTIAIETQGILNITQSTEILFRATSHTARQVSGNISIWQLK